MGGSPGMGTSLRPNAGPLSYLHALIWLVVDRNLRQADTRLLPKGWGTWRVTEKPRGHLVNTPASPLLLREEWMQGPSSISASPQKPSTGEMAQCACAHRLSIDDPSLVPRTYIKKSVLMCAVISVW